MAMLLACLLTVTPGDSQNFQRAASALVMLFLH
jgi:hypothetical protein